jgi:hypothetical protein
MNTKKMSKGEKKELQIEYKSMKPKMGLFAVINKKETKYYLETTQNLKAIMNSTLFILNLGSHPNGSLQADWKSASANGFDLQILEHLEYDKDESKTDYSEDLELLKTIWIEKLLKEGFRFY